MAQKTFESKVDELGPGNGDLGLSSREKQLLGNGRKTPLRILQSENNIIAQKPSIHTLVLKEAVISESAKVSGTKRPSPDPPMSHPYQNPSGNVANGHLVYVRRKSDAETGKSNPNEGAANSTNSSQPTQLGHQEDGNQPKSSSNESHMQCLPAHAPIPMTSLMNIPPGKPSIPISLGSKTVSEEPQTQPAPTGTTSVQPRVNKQHWEERYLQLQLFLRMLNQSSMESHLQTLRSLSAVELSRHAVELEKRAIQLSLEQAKELQRVKTLNVLGKALRTSNGEPVQQQMPKK